MKWTYSIKNKITASAVLFLLCLLVLFSNYIDRNHTKNVKNTISTLYEDRLIAEGYLLKMTNSVYQIKEQINSNSNVSFKVNTINRLILSITEENNAYQKTKFTASEKIKAKELLQTLYEFEAVPMENNQTKLKYANKTLFVLNELSDIQLKESKQIMEYAETLYQSSKTSSQFVFAVIIIILIVLQALVFSSKTLQSNFKTKPSHLN